MKEAIIEHSELIIGTVVAIGFSLMFLTAIYPGGIINNFVNQFVNSIC